MHFINLKKGLIMSYTLKERQEYNARRVAVCEALGITKNEYNKFRRLGEQLHRVYEDNCSGEDYKEADYEKALELPVKKIYEAAKGLHVYLQTDPRGGVVVLRQGAYTQEQLHEGILYLLADVGGCQVAWRSQRFASI